MKPFSYTSKRLVCVLLFLFGTALSSGLFIYSMRSHIDFFYTPTEIIYGKEGRNPHIPLEGTRVQVGGMVSPGSVQHDPQTLAVEFLLYDEQAQLKVFYQGMLPDLFAEGQGAVVKGVLGPQQQLFADKILARHDENYRPPAHDSRNR